jgi:dipeptidase D
MKGYLGGHSGNDIQRQRGNAIKDMGRVLHTLSKKIDFSLLSVLGGNAANVISQYCKAEVVMSADRVPDFRARLEELVETIRSEYCGSEPDLELKVIVGAEDDYSVLNWESTVNMIWYLYGAIDGVQAFDRNVEGAVESSLNTGIVTTEETTCVVRYQARSSIESKLDEMVQRLGLWSEIVGGHLEVDSSYPAWPYNPVSELRPLMIDVYRDMFGEEPAVEVMHAGLEGGILMGKDPDLDIVNFGPEMLNVHTPGERLNIASAAKNWEFLKEVLRRLK